MTEISSKITKIIIGVVVTVGFFYAGKLDYEEAVVNTMTQEQYEYIRERVGRDDRAAIIKEYLAKREYYDSIDYYYAY